MGIFDNTLILSDLDGTLLNSNASVSYENRKAVLYFIENGGYFSVATGRNITGMKHFLNDIKVNAPGVVCNGALIYDFVNDKVIERQCVGVHGENLAKEIIKAFPDVGIEVLMLDGSHVIKENQITKKHISYTKMPYYIESADKIEKPWLHMILCIEPNRIKELEKYVKERYSDRLFFQYSSEYFLEVVLKGVNKGKSALKVSKLLSIPKNRFFTVGDGQNDVELLKYTPNFFSPENAHPDIMAFSPPLLPCNDDNSIAALIEIVEERIKNEHSNIRQK